MKNPAPVPSQRAKRRWSEVFFLKTKKEE